MLEQVATVGDAPPSIFLHIETVYRKMMERASEEALPDGSRGMVYEGHMTKLITVVLRLPMPYYTDITRALKAMECASQIKRGGGTSQSKWALLKMPTLEDYMKYEREQGKQHRTSKTAVLEQQVKDLTERFSAAEETLIELLLALETKDEADVA